MKPFFWRFGLDGAQGAFRWFDRTVLTHVLTNRPFCTVDRILLDRTVLDVAAQLRELGLT